MNMRAIIVAAGAAFLATGCGTQKQAWSSDGTWVGAITTQGNVTTVVNESGSVWGGTARLIEEASIGVEIGDDVYMLGRVTGIAASHDRIYVADGQVPALRAYDRNGRHLRDFGREGQGPGEFRSRRIRVAVDDRGNVWLDDGDRITVFSEAGDVVTTLAKRPPFGSGSFVAALDGRVWALGFIREAADLRRVMYPYSLDGTVGHPVDLPQFDSPRAFEAESPDGTLHDSSVPFHPRGLYAFSPAPALMSGYPESYSLTIEYLDGTKRVVERPNALVSVDTNEEVAYRDAVTRFLQAVDPSWSWPAVEIPSTKPAYSNLIPTADRGVWVVRQGPGRHLADCDEEVGEPDGNPRCWVEESIVDAFDADGRYLGEVNVPEQLIIGPFAPAPPPIVRGGDVIGVVEDDAGTVMVKRYRLVPPG